MPLPSTSSLVDTSLRASVVLLLLLGLRPALRSWIGSRALAWLWLAVALRLLFPLPVSAPWRLPSLPVTPATVAASDFIFRVSVSSGDALASPRAAAGSPRPPASPQAHSALNLLSLLWLSGVLLTAARLARGWWIVRRWAARTDPPDIHSGLPSIYLALPAELRWGIDLRLTDFLDVPTLVGFLRPQIWLPRDLPATLAPAELRHVLLHELGHARRRDLLSQWLCSLACCLHWFNPLVWLLARLARTDRELACDAWVLSRGTFASETVASYGHTLLKVVEGMGRRTLPALPVVPMAAGSRHLGLAGARHPRLPPGAAVARSVRARRHPGARRGPCTLGSAVAGPDPGAVASTPPASASAPSSSPSAPAGSPPASPAPPPQSPAPWVPPIQVEIESKFIEIAKSSALKLEKSVPPSAPVSSVFHRIFAPFAAQASPDSPLIFRSSLVLPEEIDSLVRQLNQTKDVDLLSAPRVTTKSELKATIEIIREFIYPTAFQQNKGPFAKPVTTPTNFDKKNTGLTLEVTPTIEPDGKMIDPLARLDDHELRRLRGYRRQTGTPQTKRACRKECRARDFRYSTRAPSAPWQPFPRVRPSCSAGRRSTTLFRKSLRFAMGEAERKRPSEKDDDRLLLIFVKATLVHPPSASPAGNRRHRREPLDDRKRPAVVPARELLRAVSRRRSVPGACLRRRFTSWGSRAWQAGFRDQPVRPRRGLHRPARLQA